jgi:hypothetical protein
VKALVPKLLLAAAGAALALGLAEAALRWLRPEPERMFRYDERTVYELRPGAVRSFTRLAGNGGETIRMEVNSGGFRGEELEAAPERRVVVYGDSFIQAEFSAHEATFAEQLEQRLNEACPWRFEAVNAGVIGYGPDQVLRKLESDLPALEPDAVVVALFADNDFGDLLRNKIFRLSEDGVLEERPVALTASLERSLGVRRDFALVRLARRTYWQWLAWRRGDGADDDGDGETWTPNEEVVSQWLVDSRQEYVSYVLEGDPLIRDVYVDHYDADVALFPRSESATYKVRLVARLLERLEALLAGARVDRLLMIIPSPIDVCEGYDFRVDADRYEQYDRRALTRAAQEAARAAGMPSLSLWESFSANRPCSLYFHYGDNHWNDQGQALAAREAAARLVELYWPDCRAPG